MRRVICFLILQLISINCFAANTSTTNLNLTKPAIGASNWGTLMNSNMDTIDSAWKDMSDDISDVDSQITDSPEVYFSTGTFNGPTGTAITLP